MQGVIAIGLALYKALLGLYPPAFRREFASDMIQDFEEASYETWASGGWQGLSSFAFITGMDVARGVLMQWLRSGRAIVMGLAFAITGACAAVIGTLDLRVRYVIQPSSPERDGVFVLILVTTVVVIIAATVIFSLIFVRPALTRHAGRRRV
jgi:hypothetical protein